MTEFWETSFKEKRTMWGEAPADSAIRAAQLFQARNHKTVLIPGIGYGRNGQPFLDAGMEVTGIEISQTAIALARERFGSSLRIFHGSATEMPYENKMYDGIFSFALIHLLNEAGRQKLIASAFAQLQPGGSMIFVTIADTAPMFGTGKKISERIYETLPGVTLFFYDASYIEHEFGRYDLQTFYPVSEPAKNAPGGPSLDFLWIECVKMSKTH